MEIKKYNKEFDYSYTLGAFPTFELIKYKAEEVIEVFAHSSFTDIEKLDKLCAEKKVKLSINDKIINKLSDKGNVYVVGIFKKFEDRLEENKPHVVLVNPSDMGNVGTIFRSAAAFNIRDLAIVEPAADIFNPKTVRASMGSIFRIRHTRFNSFEDYQKTILPNRELFTFMLNGENQLTVSTCPKPEVYSLIFGNEATGLDDSFLKIGTSIIIPQSELVDSLNLTIAAGVGMYMFQSR